MAEDKNRFPRADLKVIQDFLLENTSDHSLMDRIGGLYDSENNKELDGKFEFYFW